MPQLTFRACTWPSPTRSTRPSYACQSPGTQAEHATDPVGPRHGGEQPTDGPRVGKRLGPVGPPPSPHPKSRHMWLTLTGLPESNQPFAERHSLNDNANHLLHYLACASVRKRKEPSLLILCENFCSIHLASDMTFFFPETHFM